VNPASGLHAGLLISAKHIVVIAERLIVKDSRVQIQYSSRFDGKVRVARKDPGPMLPRLERISGQPASHGGRRH
jgi:hypothetical protein